MSKAELRAALAYVEGSMVQLGKLETLADVKRLARNTAYTIRELLRDTACKACGVADDHIEGCPIALDMAREDLADAAGNAQREER